MRDRDRIIADGRNDPDSPEQQREHPYDFVELPPKVEKLDAARLDRRRVSRDGLWIQLTLRFTLLQPVAVGSGAIGLVGGKATRLALTDGQDSAVVPGASLKGALRSNYEAITRSCVWNARTSYNEPPQKLPGALGGRQSGAALRVSINPTPQAMRPCVVRDRPPSLCPACGLFGALGYRGRLAFEDAVVVVPNDASKALRVYEEIPALSSGQPHRVGEATRKGNEIVIGRLWGRRVHLRPDKPRAADKELEGMERVQALIPTTVLRTRMSLLDVQPCELGGLLHALGCAGGLPLLRLGGFKPVGFGQARVEIEGVISRSGEAVNPDELRMRALAEFESWPAFWPKGLSELNTILSRPVARSVNR
jgi:hypothetical protein